MTKAGALLNKSQDPPVYHDLELSLEEMYKGTIKKISITRNVFNV
jgi:DnaJ-class molecular chaperone